MTQHADILDSPSGIADESLRRGFLWALIFHVTLFAVYGIYSLMSSSGETFGAQDAGGGAIGIEAVSSIPLPHSGRPNPVANDSESQVPQAPLKPAPRVQPKKEKVSPNAVAFKIKDKRRPAEVASELQKYRSFKDLDANQTFAKQAPQVSNPIYAALPGAGRIGANPTTFGTNFAAYGAQVQSNLARAWNTSGIDPSVQSAPPVIAAFEILRDGSVRNPRLLQLSGIVALDNSVKRAMADVHFPPLPSAFPRDTAQVEFTFEFKR
jgi:outer membrane biosynthesis protein TonB